jgi:uncharacterized protein (TIGR02594 family)
MSIQKRYISFSPRGNGIPEIQYWFSGAAVLFLLPFIISVALGLIPLMDGTREKLPLVLLLGSLLTTIVGWHEAAKQAQAAAAQDEQAAGQRKEIKRQSERLQLAQDSLQALRGQLADLNLQMNRVLPPLDASEIALLSPDAPQWIKAAYDERGQNEIAGPQENPHIIQYFRSISAEPRQDDIQDWASAFVAWSLKQADIQMIASDDPFSWLNWGQVLKKPVFGCIVVMSFSGLHHVGFYFGEDESFVHVLGRNEDDAVNIFRYPKSAVVGYRWPAGLKIPDGE